MNYLLAFGFLLACAVCGILASLVVYGMTADKRERSVRIFDWILSVPFLAIIGFCAWAAWFVL